MSSYKNWVHAMNPFSRATRGSFIKLDELATDHKTKLSSRSSDTDIDQLYQRFLPIYTQFKTHYLAWKSANFDQVTATDLTNDLLQEFLSERLNRWDSFLQYSLGVESNEYMSIMHGGRVAFRYAPKHEKINLIRVLADRLGLFPQLSTIHQEATAFVQTLLEAMEDQKEAMERKRFASIELKRAHDLVCAEMFRNLGNLIMLYPHEPDKITHFFQMELVRQLGSRSSALYGEESVIEGEEMNEFMEEENGLRESELQCPLLHSNEEEEVDGS